jgi:hypothetical protein
MILREVPAASVIIQSPRTLVPDPGRSLRGPSKAHTGSIPTHRDNMAGLGRLIAFQENPNPTPFRNGISDVVSVSSSGPVIAFPRWIEAARIEQQRREHKVPNAVRQRQSDSRDCYPHLHQRSMLRERRSPSEQSPCDVHPDPPQIDSPPLDPTAIAPWRSVQHTRLAHRSLWVNSVSGESAPLRMIIVYQSK